jgi:methane/ammonia monooxygenase subunit B
MHKLLAKPLALLAALACTAVLLPAPEALAHGGRAQEPYLRTRTTHWYDVKWSTNKLAVNEEIVMTAKFRLFGDWPDAVDQPETVFVSNGTPGPVLVRGESYLNGVPARQSFRNLEVGRDYEYKLVMKARVPGLHHVHPMIQIKGSGPLVGPGQWITITGDWADFTFPVNTLDGTTIDNLENWGVKGHVVWQLILVAIAAAWLLWWIRRPLLIPRYQALMKGREDLLITPSDLKAGAALIVVVLATVFGGYSWAKSSYPRTVPLQTGTMYTPPLPKQPVPVRIVFQRAEYDVPGRSMRVTMEVTNTSDHPLQLGEFTSANLRFVNQNSEAGKAGVDAAYPKEFVARAGLAVENVDSFKPGESRTITLRATDVAWEVERLTSFLTDVDSKFGGLLFFFDAQGRRHIAEVGGPILPVFRKS